MAYTKTRVERNPAVVSYWQFDPHAVTDEGVEVEGMDCAMTFLRTEENRVLVALRGKVRGRSYEPGDAAWLEFTDEQAIHFMERMAATLRRHP
jgi:hypothetical protein